MNKNKRTSNIVRQIIVFFFLNVLLSGITTAPSLAQIAGKTDNSPDWFYPEWASKAMNSTPIVVLDTDSSLGRYSLKTKEIGLKDLARIHGHMCDGLVVAFVQIKAVLNKLFPSGVVDRTDLRAVSKNGPCWVDAITFMTGARFNFQTLRIDNTIGDGYIIQKISTGEAYKVHLKKGIFPKELADLEGKIRQLRARGEPVKAEDINQIEKMQDTLSLRVLTTPPSELLDMEPLTGYRFVPADFFGQRGDIINKSMPR